ncbi:MAG TPA: 30S ribosomal protein S20 [Acidimicrobiia bacterium]|nr:30S ribosomal protein S20 [Acidimicrobiia bacterium]
MANIKSQMKRNRQNDRRRMRNKVARSELKTRIKRAAEGLEAGTEDAADRVRAAQRRLGKAAGKGVVHRNQAARRTSRLMKRAAKTGSS